MTIAVQKRLYTGAELYEINARGQQQYELVNGELVEVAPVNFAHGNIAVRVSSRLSNFVDDLDLGSVMVETGYYVQHNPDIVRGPDVSFINKSKIPLAQKTVEGYLDFPPDLAVEVVSPGDRPGEILQKINLYLAAGVPLLWIIYPEEKLVNVIRPDKPLKILTEKDYLDGYEIIPGFKLALSVVFKPYD